LFCTPKVKGVVVPDKFTFSGTPEQLMMMLSNAQVLYHMTKGIESDGGGSFAEKEMTQKFEGKFRIKLLFLGKTQTGKKKKVEKSFRLMKVDPSTVTLKQLQDLAKKIHSKFNTWKILTGKNAYNYVHWEQGVQLQQMYFKDIAEAKRLVEAILDITGQAPDWEYMNIDTSAEPEERYPEIPDKYVLAGKSVRTYQQRPYGTVSFIKAYILFPHISRYEFLCDADGNIIKDLNFLDNYNG
jgi:hypothetical protein